MRLHTARSETVRMAGSAWILVLFTLCVVLVESRDLLNLLRRTAEEKGAASVEKRGIGVFGGVTEEECQELTADMHDATVTYNADDMECKVVVPPPVHEPQPEEGAGTVDKRAVGVYTGVTEEECRERTADMPGATVTYDADAMKCRVYIPPQVHKPEYGTIIPATDARTVDKRGTAMLVGVTWEECRKRSANMGATYTYDAITKECVVNTPGKVYKPQTEEDMKRDQRAIPRRYFSIP